MKIVVHFCDTTAEIQVAASSQTWGRLCQQFCETKLLHRPQLLQLLTCLDNDAKNTNYMFRYGDGNGTVVRVDWNCCEEGRIQNEKLIEANITLRARSNDGLDDADGVPNISPGAPVAASLSDGVDSPEKTMEVDLHVEKVGVEEEGGVNAEKVGTEEDEEEEVDSNAEKVGVEEGGDGNVEMDGVEGEGDENVEKVQVGEEGDGNEEKVGVKEEGDGNVEKAGAEGEEENEEEEEEGDDGNATVGTCPFAMTQTPFPTDDNKTHVLFVKEHLKFNEVIDRYLLADQRYSGDWLKKFSTQNTQNTQNNVGAGAGSANNGNVPASLRIEDNERRPIIPPRKRRQSSPAKVTRAAAKRAKRLSKKTETKQTKSVKRSQSRTKNSAGDNGTSKSPRKGVNVRWEERFQELSEYHEEHGDCRVPRGPGLGEWVSTQRKCMKQYQQGNKSSITPERVKRLESLGFEWNLNNWDKNYEVLCDFVKDNGHCLVPRNCGNLGRWCSYQYERYINATMTDEQIKKLEKLGFQWPDREEAD
mmetsp:Transcript_28028/g.59176  ORF Transcript_28028/g.59176 Transcript_28028/m.59176 type:complete len:531 (+) Transcript_28028:30-1622(+)